MAGRGQDARSCGVQAACFVPVSAPGQASHPIAVIEAALDRDCAYPLATVKQQICLGAEVPWNSSMLFLLLALPVILKLCYARLMAGICLVSPCKTHMQMHGSLRRLLVCWCPGHLLLWLWILDSHTMVLALLHETLLTLKQVPH